MANVSLLFLLFSVFSNSLCQDMISSKFSKQDKICDVVDRVERGCSSQIPESRSLIECFSMCGSDKSCIGASLDTDGLCFHHKECPTISGCAIENSNHLHMTRYCAHGFWDNPSHACKCVDGFFGERCKQCHKHCKDLLSHGYDKRGFYRVYIDPDHDGQKPFLIQCYLNPPGYSAVQVARNRGRHDFNKTWLEYVHGFYYDDQHVWGGLYSWHRLSNVGLNEMIFVFEYLSRSNIPAVYRRHYGMHISNESTGFRFTIGSSGHTTRGTVPSGNYFGDCLGPLENIPFSTWDSDNDGSEDTNCAAVTGSGWWYTGCDNPCNTLGYELQYLNTKPRNQIMSLLGVDIESIATEDFMFIMYLPD